MTVIRNMVPVSARRQINYNLESLGENAPVDRILDSKKPFSLLHINRKLLFEPRKFINARIVVVGASDTGIAFLETLIFKSNLRFNNLTIISANGLPGDRKCSNFAHMLLSHSYSYTELDYVKMGLQNWVNVVIGQMTSIDRKEKIVSIHNNSYMAYDFLILCTGTQYLITCPPQMDPKTSEVDTNLKTPPGKKFLTNIPETVLVINDLADAEKCLFNIRKNLGVKQKIVIYGETLDAYCCLNGLLCSGVKSKQIVFVTPPRDTKSCCFENRYIKCKIKNILDNLKNLNFVKDMQLSYWRVDADGKLLNQVIFRNKKGDVLDLPCRILILYNHKGVDYDAFEAINCSALVFDRRLVIDANFRTNDPAIRSAGPMTKYQRIYYCEQWTHFRFNSQEIGSHLASSMMSIFDPSYDPPPSQSSPIKITTTYTNPKIIGGSLPGRFNFLHVHKPKLDTLLDDEMADPSYGIVLTSGSVDEDKGYFRLHLSKDRVVETITCFSNKTLLISNIIHLYGLHHKYLNNLLGRWYEGLVSDLFCYFHEPWAMILYHDRFRCFREEVRMLLAEASHLPVNFIKGFPEDNVDEFIRNVLDANYMTEEKNKVLVTMAYKNWGIDKKIQQRLANYIHYNYYHLPMYAKPGMI